MRVIEKLGVIFRELSRRIGNCRYPLYLSPEMVLDSRGLRSIAPERRYCARAPRRKCRMEYSLTVLAKKQFYTKENKG